jgi:hypothetical protein
LELILQRKRQRRAKRKKERDERRAAEARLVRDGQPRRSSSTWNRDDDDHEGDDDSSDDDGGNEDAHVASAAISSGIGSTSNGASTVVSARYGGSSTGGSGSGTTRENALSYAAAALTGNGRSGSAPTAATPAQLAQARLREAEESLWKRNDDIFYGDLTNSRPVTGSSTNRRPGSSGGTGGPSSGNVLGHQRGGSRAQALQIATDLPTNTLSATSTPHPNPQPSVGGGSGIPTSISQPSLVASTNSGSLTAASFSHQRSASVPPPRSSSTIMPIAAAHVPTSPLSASLVSPSHVMTPSSGAAATPSTASGSPPMTASPFTIIEPHRAASATISHGADHWSNPIPHRRLSVGSPKSATRAISPTHADALENILAAVTARTSGGISPPPPSVTQSTTFIPPSTVYHPHPPKDGEAATEVREHSDHDAMREKIRTPLPVSIYPNTLVASTSLTAGTVSSTLPSPAHHLHPAPSSTSVSRMVSSSSMGAVGPHLRSQSVTLVSSNSSNSLLSPPLLSPSGPLSPGTGAIAITNVASGSTTLTAAAPAAHQRRSSGRGLALLTVNERSTGLVATVATPSSSALSTDHSNDNGSDDSSSTSTSVPQARSPVHSVWSPAPSRLVAQHTLATRFPPVVASSQSSSRAIGSGNTWATPGIDGGSPQPITLNKKRSARDRIPSWMRRSPQSTHRPLLAGNVTIATTSSSTPSGSGMNTATSTAAAASSSTNGGGGGGGGALTSPNPQSRSPGAGGRKAQEARLKHAVCYYQSHHHGSHLHAIILLTHN